MDRGIYDTFKRGSRTYFYSSVFFPPAIRQDVFTLYAFVRTADDFVDRVPQDSASFYDFKTRFIAARAGTPSGDVIIDSYTALERRLGFDHGWADAFLASMEMDLTKKDYANLDETILYMYGSAEVIGLFMSVILGLDPRSRDAARLQGRAMQYINFIRDISEDLSLGRTYLPLADSGLSALHEPRTPDERERFVAFIRAQIDRYREWQSGADEGYRFIPKRYLIPIKTAADMYGWTAKQIYRDPLVVYRKKMKPAIPRICAAAVRNKFSIKTKKGDQ